ncbi:MAG: phosphotransferase family protein [Candidatus Heimdallarchaeota archaeon]
MPFKSEIPISEKKVHEIILHNFPNETISSILEIKRSFINPVYDIALSNGQNYILRINNPHWPDKQKRELTALTLAREKTSIPIPKIVFFDSNQKLIPYDYMIQEKAPGMELNTAIASGQLKEDQLEKIIEQLASYLGELHSIHFDFFGDFNQKESYPIKQQVTASDRLWGSKYANWQLCFKAFCFDNLNWVDTSSFVNMRKPLITKIDEFSKRVPQPEIACFVHSDIQPTNILVHEGEISAILDFEWSYAGSSSFDYDLTLAGLYFGNFPSLDKSNVLSNYKTLTKDRIEKLFLQGYQKSYKGKIYSEPEGLRDFIWLLYMIGSWDWSVKSSTKDEITAFEKDVRELYSRFT